MKFADDEPAFLDRVSVSFEPHSFNAVIGPSGCGKTTLIKSILGIFPSEGQKYIGDEFIESPESIVGKVGFIPQFTSAHKNLKVEECLSYALRLCLSDRAEQKTRLTSILELTGLSAHKDKHVYSLSGGQLRRLGLALELTSNPPCLVCDEVTSGLDPQSEDHILNLLKGLCRDQGKTCINIIHNLGKLHVFDSITVVFEGDVIFQGSLKELKYYFEIDDPLVLYEKLNSQTLEFWQSRWKHYHQGMGHTPSEYSVETSTKRPSSMSQMLTLLSRRFRLFFRDKGYFWLTLAITFGFPAVVIIFALDGLPAIESLALDQSHQSLLEAMEGQISLRIESMKTASLVTGLIMFQVILLTLMGSNNGAREIAGERNLYEKERLNGLSPNAYAIAKMIFLACIAITQGLIMTGIVKWVCEFPGPWLSQAIILSLCCLSMSYVCLGFSALFRSSEKASLISIYLVGFQLPLSGVVLALPDTLTWICRPFINAYWAWVGYVSSMLDTRIYDAITINEPSFFQVLPGPAAAVLCLQALLGIALVFSGCQKRLWD